jgi:hypothetical protein
MKFKHRFTLLLIIMATSSIHHVLPEGKLIVGVVFLLSALIFLDE